MMSLLRSAEASDLSVVSQRTGPALHVQRENLRLLFVDSDPILCEFATANLAGENLGVETAADADAALAALRDARPDVLLIEANLTGLDGLTLLTTLRANPQFADLPVLVIAGREDIDAVARAYDAGADAFVVKPLNWRLLAHQVRYVHRGAASTRSLADQLARLAATGAKFISGALAREPALKADAVAFAKAADAALKSDGVADAA
jgi:DNA-binding response OmpR family regulator